MPHENPKEINKYVKTFLVHEAGLHIHNVDGVFRSFSIRNRDAVTATTIILDEKSNDTILIPATLDIEFEAPPDYIIKLDKIYHADSQDITVVGEKFPDHK